MLELWLAAALLQGIPDCGLSPLEQGLVEHYISWEAAKQYRSWAGRSTSARFARAVRAEDGAYLDLPLQRTAGDARLPAGLDLYRTVLHVNQDLVPPVGPAFGWNPGTMEDSFDAFLNRCQIRILGRCTVTLPSTIAAWQPSPLGPAKQALLDAMVRAASADLQWAAVDRSLTKRQTEWWLYIEDFHVDDPTVSAVLIDVKSGRYVLSQFALNRLLPNPVLYDRVRGTDLEKISVQDHVGKTPIKLKIAP